MDHPIIEQLSPNEEQWPAIRVRGKDVVVTAGAGTGKTRTLVARYLSLLADGFPLRSIVAVTFTRKAAREMRNRVRDEIRRYLSQPDLDDGEQRRWQGLYTELDAARIGTIHSLCAEILRAHPAEAGVDPRFEVLEEGQVSLLRRRAVEEAMGWAADEPETARLFLLLGERDLRRTLERLLAKRLDAREAFDRLPDDLLAHWRKGLEGRQEAVLARLLARPEWREAVATLQEYSASKPTDRIEVQRRAALAAIEGATGSPSERWATLAQLDRINLTGGSGAAWPEGGLTEVKQALRTLRDLWRGAAKEVPDGLNGMDERLAQALPLLRRLFDFACARYEALKQERNALDYDDLEAKALALLRDCPLVRERWQQEVRAVLVDEFQDTNGRQRDLIRLLNGDGGKRFLVGDAKQSIYRFRGADVTVFREERKAIEAGGGAAFDLSISYRAHDSLVEALNALLRPVLGEAEDPDRPWVEPFAPIRAHRQDPIPGLSAPYVELHLTVGSKSGGALDRAADALVARLIELKESAHLDYDDVAILCRASGSFAAYEDALERAGVPFLTVAGRGFYDRPEVRDLLNALQALADPTDDLALVGLLRSPAFALSDAALYHLVRMREEADPVLPLWEVLRERGGDLPGEDGVRAERAVRIVADLHGRVGRASVADVLKGLLDGTDYRAALLRAGQRRAARNVAKLLADAHASGLVGVGEFLEYVRSLRDVGVREGEARALAEGAVQVMTVHAAKGLEFPIVVLGDASYGGGGREGLLLDPDLGVLLPLKDEDGTLPAAYRLGKARADDQEAAEADRLLYVAATRAQEVLLISGCIGLKQDGTPGKMGGWLGRLAGPLGLSERAIEYDEEGDRVHRVDLQVGTTPVACFVYGPGWKGGRPLASQAERPSAPLHFPLLRRIAPEEGTVDRKTAEREREPPQRVWRVVPRVEHPTAPAWVVGLLVHEALAAWRFPGEGFDRWAEACARTYGLTDPRQLSDAVSRARRLLDRFKDHPLFEEMDQAGRRLHEVPYSLVVDGRVESGVIDALYLQDGVWTLVEFKTDEVRDESALERLLETEDYVPQVERYIAAVERLVGCRPRALLCLLNCRGEVRLYVVDKGALSLHLSGPRGETDVRSLGGNA